MKKQIVGPETLQAATPLRAALRAGFTLIELLVVVLIIGILSAVALPKYEKAVDKSRVTGYMQTGYAIRKAQEIMLMESGAYTADLNALALDTTKGCSVGVADPSIMSCPKFHVDNIVGSVVPGGVSNSHQVGVSVLKGGVKWIAVHFYFKDSGRSNDVVCMYSDNYTLELCKSLNLTLEALAAS